MNRVGDGEADEPTTEAPKKRTVKRKPVERPDVAEPTLDELRVKPGGPMRAEEAQMSSEGAVKALCSLDANDPETAHSHADSILLLSVPPRVRQAYLDLAAKCEWWVTA